MRIRIDKWLVVVMVVALSTLSWWMPLEQTPVTTLVTGSEPRHVSDYDLAGFDITTMDSAGQPRYQLQGHSMRHYADDDTAIVLQPRLTVYRHQGAPWLMSAGQAQVAKGAETVLLQEDVKLQRVTDVPQDKIEVQTPALRVMPDRQYADTDQPVTIISDMGVTRAVGMKADLKAEHLELLAQVRGEYVEQ